MSLKNIKKEDLELLSNKDITNLLLEEKGCQNTANLFKKIIKLLELPESTFDKKIGDYYTSLTTDKRFILLEDGTWDLRSRHTSDKLVKMIEDDEEEELEEMKEDEEEELEEDLEDNYDSIDSDEDDISDSDDDLKDLVVLDEDELELEQ
ncbi:MAG: DNA-directed RNA polymerase subunit delta [bacterium]|nr:DNA-directed RNA polymerase subunit delta [bacterium]